VHPLPLGVSAGSVSQISNKYFTTGYFAFFRFFGHNCLTCWPIDLGLIYQLPCARLSCDPGSHSPSFLFPVKSPDLRAPFLLSSCLLLTTSPQGSRHAGSAPFVHNRHEITELFPAKLIQNNHLIFTKLPFYLLPFISSL